MALALSPACRSSPRAPRGAAAGYPTVREHTLPPPPLGAAPRAGGGDALRRAGTRSRRERAGSTSPGPGPTQLIRGWLSGKDAALRSPNSPKTGSSRPEMGATCAARLGRYVSKEDSGEQTTRSPFSCRLKQWLHGKFKGGGGDHIFCLLLKEEELSFIPRKFLFLCFTNREPDFAERQKTQVGVPGTLSCKKGRNGEVEEGYKRDHQLSSALYSLSFKYLLF